jgi:thiamine biosynthesis lipoprotein ApbE
VELEFLGADSNDDRAPYRFRLANLSMATSGGQFQNFPDWKSKTQQDKTSHIIDPQDGGGLVGRQLVTIFAAEASDADAAATAGCVQLRRNNGQWLSELSGRENGMFGIAQEIIQGKSNVIEFGGFSEKLNFIRS